MQGCFVCGASVGLVLAQRFPLGGCGLFALVVPPDWEGGQFTLGTGGLFGDSVVSSQEEDLSHVAVVFLYVVMSGIVVVAT